MSAGRNDRIINVCGTGSMKSASVFKDRSFYRSAIINIYISLFHFRIFRPAAFTDPHTVVITYFRSGNYGSGRNDIS